MGRMYIIQFAAVTVSAAQDLFEIKGASGKPFKIHEIRITQDSEAGDAMSEQLRFTIKRALSGYTSGSGGSTPSVLPINVNDAAAGVSAEANNTVRAATNGGGTVTTLLTAADNIHNGWHYLPTPECQMTFPGDGAAVVGLESTPADAITMNGYALVEEIY